MKYKYSKKIVIFCASLLIVIISAFLFCMNLFFNTEDVKPTVLISYNNNSKLIINNTSPITDTLGKRIDSVSEGNKTSYTEFSISSNIDNYDKIDYEIYAKEVNTSNVISSSYVKLYLTEANTDRALSNSGNIVKTFDELQASSNDADVKIIYKGTLKNGEVDDFKLRMWLADTYTVSNELKNFEIALYVKVVE